jgi:hypothetical protein
MHTGIGPAATDYVHRLSEQQRKFMIDLGLDRMRIGLDLPPMVSLAVVGQLDEIAEHRYAKDKEIRLRKIFGIWAALRSAKVHKMNRWGFWHFDYLTRSTHLQPYFISF